MVPINISQRVQLARIAACVAHGVSMSDFVSVTKNDAGKGASNAVSRARHDMIRTLRHELGFMGLDWCCAQAGYRRGGNVYESISRGGPNPSLPIYEDYMKHLTGVDGGS